MKLGIVIGIEKYQSKLFDDIPACRNDATAIRSVLQNVKEMDEILFLLDEAGLEAKRKISDFIEKFKDTQVEELTFYFSGHGERTNEDFFYVFTDFERSKKETTGLRNSELDTLAKALTPKLFIKIVDACFSGTQYIKGDLLAQEESLQKSISKHGFNNVYFWHSSSGHEPSWAGSEYSRFTESILTSLTDQTGEIRYSEIMSKVADDLSTKGAARPTFISQADHIEKFGLITESTHSLIYDLFGISESQPTESTEEPQPRTEISIFDTAREKSTKSCHSEQTVIDFIQTFNTELNQWDTDLNKVYSVTVSHDRLPIHIPNNAVIGSWLEAPENQGYFAFATHDQESYVTEEYKKLPKKPGRAALALAGFLGGDDSDYRLETVKKSRSYVSGFEYSHSAEHQISIVKFSPNIEIADPATLFTIILYSNRSLAIHFSYECLRRVDWNNFTQPKCKDWRILKVNTHGDSPAKSAASHIKSEIKQWIEDSLKSKIEQQH